ncbi:MAG: hypothetical protein ACW99G_20320 [Candidatus Thorarchaeota archaeon]|jgi:hypothetical protein
MNIDLQQIYIIKFVTLRHSLGEVNTLRECPKCQRQNQPTRKYCTRCGANLLEPIEEKPSTPETSVEETPPTPITPSSEPVPTEDTPLVRPSKVETDRVIPPERHVDKTELEKAKETFAQADEIGVEEEAGEGIVEPRMLRASEVRELMDSAEGWTEPETTQPGETSESPDAPAPPPMPTTDDIEKGILGAKSEFVDKPEPVPESPPPQPDVSVSPTPTSTPEPIPVVEETAATTAEVLPDVTTEIWEYEAKVPDKEYLDDFNIKGMLSDVKNLLMELRLAESDLTSCTSQHDETVQQYRNVAEVKRISFETLEEQTKHAKEAWNDSEKEYRLADDRRKKEISSREKRVDKIQKQINKVESSLEKRVKELDKQKEKRAQEQAKRT